MADVGGGVFAALAGLPGNIAFGLIAFAPLGALLSGGAVQATMLSAALGTLALIAVGRSSVLLAAPSAPIAMILADLLTRFQADGATVPQAMAGVIGASLVCGVALFLFAMLRIGRIINFIPQPMVAGILTGTAVLIAVAQIGPLFASADTGASLAVTLIVAAIGFTAMAVGQSAGRPVLGAAAGLVLGLAAAHLAPLLGLPAPSGGRVAAADGPGLWSMVGDGWGAVPDVLFGPQWPVVLGAGVSMSVLVAMTTLLSGFHMRGLLLCRVEGNRLLAAAGLGALGGALVAAMPSNGNISRTTAALALGARTRRAPMAYAATTLVLAGGTAAVLEAVPAAVLAGIVMAVGLRLIDRAIIDQILDLLRGRPPRSTDALVDLGLVIVVALATVAVSVIVAVAIGLLCALVVFAVRVSSPVRRVLPADQLVSRLERRASLDAAFQDLRATIFVVELQGPLFFGSIERLTLTLDDLARRGARHVVLDMRRVTSTDVSFVHALADTITFFGANGLDIVVSAVDATRVALPDNARRFPDAAAALEDLDTRLLATLTDPATAAGDTIESFLTEQGMSAADATSVATAFERVAFETADEVMRAGDRDTFLYLVLEGALEVLIADGRGQPKRIRTLAAGAVFGEMALLDGEPRAATVRTLQPSVCCRLNREGLDDLARRTPHAATAFHSMLARLLARRLRAANVTITELEG